MMTDTYPRTAPPGTPAALIKTGLWRCGFCASGNHASCPAMVRNGPLIKRDENGHEISREPRLVLCRCCGTGQPARCLDCGNTNPDEVNSDHWACLYPDICAGRIRLRQEHSHLYQTLQACKTAAFVRRRTIRVSRDQMLVELPADEDARLDSLQESLRRRTARLGGQRPSSGLCVCCGEPTRGGLFRPGHDAKYKSRLRREAATGDVNAQTELEQRGWV